MFAAPMMHPTLGHRRARSSVSDAPNSATDSRADSQGYSNSQHPSKPNIPLFPGTASNSSVPLCEHPPPPRFGPDRICVDVLYSQPAYFAGDVFRCSLEIRGPPLNGSSDSSDTEKTGHSMSRSNSLGRLPSSEASSKYSVASSSTPSKVSHVLLEFLTLQVFGLVVCPQTEGAATATRGAPTVPHSASHRSIWSGTATPLKPDHSTGTGTGAGSTYAYSAASSPVRSVAESIAASDVAAPPPSRFGFLSLGFSLFGASPTPAPLQTLEPPGPPSSEPSAASSSPLPSVRESEHSSAAMPSRSRVHGRPQLPAACYDPPMLDDAKLLFKSGPCVLCKDLSFPFVEEPSSAHVASGGGGGPPSRRLPSTVYWFGFECLLPPFLPPTYSGTAGRYAYYVSLVAQKRLEGSVNPGIETIPIQIRLPIHILGPRQPDTPLLPSLGSLILSYPKNFLQRGGAGFTRGDDAEVIELECRRFDFCARAWQGGGASTQISMLRGLNSFGWLGSACENMFWASGSAGSQEPVPNSLEADFALWHLTHDVRIMGRAYAHSLLDPEAHAFSSSVLCLGLPSPGRSSVSSVNDTPSSLLMSDSDGATTGTSALYSLHVSSPHMDAVSPTRNANASSPSTSDAAEAAGSPSRVLTLSSRHEDSGGEEPRPPPFPQLPGSLFRGDVWGAEGMRYPPGTSDRYMMSHWGNLGREEDEELVPPRKERFRICHDGHVVGILELGGLQRLSTLSAGPTVDDGGEKGGIRYAVPVGGSLDVTLDFENTEAVPYEVHAALIREERMVQGSATLTRTKLALPEDSPHILRPLARQPLASELPGSPKGPVKSSVVWEHKAVVLQYVNASFKVSVPSGISPSLVTDTTDVSYSIEFRFYCAAIDGRIALLEALGSSLPPLTGPNIVELQWKTGIVLLPPSPTSVDSSILEDRDGPAPLTEYTAMQKGGREVPLGGRESGTSFSSRNSVIFTYGVAGNAPLMGEGFGRIHRGILF